MRRRIIMRTIKFLLAILFSLAVAACGGGGYGGGGSASTTYSISGTVTLSGGAPVPNVTIILTDSSSRTTTHTTGTDGSYSFTGLGNGYYTVMPSAGVYSTYAPTSYTGTNLYIYGASLTGENFTAS
jgi:hypothetical protein